MDTQSKFTTKVTNVNGTYHCRVDYDGKPVVEARVTSREDIGPALRCLLRTMDKLGGDRFTHAARYRSFQPGNRYMGVQHYWYDKNGKLL